MTLASRSGYVLAGIGLAGTSLISACAPADPGPSAEALAACHRAIEKASLALHVAADDLSPTDRQAARSQLENARNRVLHVWAGREGLEIEAESFALEQPAAEAFLAGIEAEAGLSEQDRLTALSEAADDPDAWRDTLDTALDCSEEVAP